MDKIPHEPSPGKLNPGPAQVQYLEEYARGLFDLIPNGPRSGLNREELRTATEVFLKFHPLEVEDLDAEEWLPKWAGHALHAANSWDIESGGYSKMARRCFDMADAMLAESRRRRLGGVL